MDGPIAVSNIAAVRAALIAAAQAGQAKSYAELLADLGHRFTRPLMRALCKTLDVIDEDARVAGEPELAVLVVRESDRLPGQGWWISGRLSTQDHDASWTGPEAMALVRDLQRQAFEYWQARGGAPGT